MSEANELMMKLELVPMPATDIDRARDFYVQQVGFHLDHDMTMENGTRVVQLTPPGSACSILLSEGLPDLAGLKPGTHKGLHLVVDDLRAVRAALIERGVQMGEVIEFPGGMLYSGFSDPDGNTWTLQEIPAAMRS